MRYVELFAGAGGLSMGLEAAGMHPVAHAEIEPHARAVLRRQWPDTPLHGDVTQVDWAQYAGQVDLVAGGSPCQDLSVAGKRAGLAGARSGLFYELIRAWDETGAPYCLWENVDGARSSNKGEDFAAVLSAFVGSPVAVPGTGRWTGAGVVAGATGVAAWRVLDLQHFGPPQRRRRLFVVAARTGGADPAEILALAEGVCGHPSPREQSREGVARGAAGGAGGSISWDNELNARVEAHGPLMARGKSGGDRNGVLAIAIKGSVIGRSDDAGSQRSITKDDAMFCLQTGEVHGVLAFTTTQTPKVGGDVALTLEAASRSGGGQTPAVLAFDTTQITSPANYSHPKPGDPCHPLAAGAHPPTVLSFQQSSCTGRGTMGVDENMTVLRPVRPQRDHQMICLASGQANAEVMRDVVGALDFGGHGGSYNGQDAYQGRILPAAGRPRRLTPLECERLMGWPDRHTAQGVKEDGTVYALSDTARYRLCGNGVGTPVAAWIATRLVAAVEGLCPP